MRAHAIPLLTCGNNRFTYPGVLTTKQGVRLRTGRTGPRMGHVRYARYACVHTRIT